jgi:NitT/TauT family transport system ATP-binding protein/sulfonate transport system ATP-binding protein
MNGLELDAISRTFPGPRGAPPTRALEPLSLAVPDRDFVAVVGPSGCGKSTLLRIVAGLTAPSGGRVTLDGVAVRGPGPDRGLVPQSSTLFPWLTVEDNVGFGLRERGVPPAHRRTQARRFLERVGLMGFEHHYPGQLSGGMQQRAALARALAAGPRMLLLDEPFGALDYQTRALMQELLLGIWEQDRTTVLLVTHDVDEALFLANRVLVMTARPGRVKAEIAVDLPRPRSYRVKTEPAFAVLKARVTEEIRVEVLRDSATWPR